MLLNQSVWGSVSLIFREILFLEGTLAAEQVMIQVGEYIMASTFKWTGYRHIHLFPVVDYVEVDGEWNLKSKQMYCFTQIIPVSVSAWHPDIVPFAHLHVINRNENYIRFTSHKGKTFRKMVIERNATVVFLNECYDCPLWVN